MARTLARNMGRFEDWLTTTSGIRFRGVIMPAPDAVSANQIIETRLMLRVRSAEPVNEGLTVIDAAGRVFLMGRDDTQLDTNATIAKTYRLFRMVFNVSWQRAATVADPITQLPKRTAMTEIGPIWCAIEPMGALVTDLGTRMPAELRRVITGAPVQLHDTVNGRLVKRVIPVFGVTIAETE